MSLCSKIKHQLPHQLDTNGYAMIHLSSQCSADRQKKRIINQGIKKIHPNTCRAIAEASLWMFLHRPVLCSALSSAFLQPIPYIKHGTPVAKEIIKISKKHQQWFPSIPREPNSPNRVLLTVVLASLCESCSVPFKDAFRVSHALFSLQCMYAPRPLPPGSWSSCFS